MRPSRSEMAARICWMRRAFWSAIPPQRMASATCPAGAAATRSQLENLSLSCANARSELMSEVCCDKTVATTSSMTGSTGLGANGPCSARSRRCTSLMRPWPGAVMGGWYPPQGKLGLPAAGEAVAPQRSEGWPPAARTEA